MKHEKKGNREAGSGKEGLSVIRVRGKLTLRNEAIVSAREEMGLSAPQAAKVAGVSYRTFWLIESFRNTSAKEKTIDKIAEALGLSREEVLPSILQGKKVVSLHEATGEVETGRLIGGAVVETRMIEGPSAEVIQSEAERTLGSALRRLTYREREVLKMRRGLFGEEILSCNATSRVLGVSRERVRQIEQKAERKLKWECQRDGGILLGHARDAKEEE